MRRPFGDDASVVDDPDAVCEDVCLLEILRRQEDGDAVLAREPSDLVPERGAALDVEPGGRLVEEEDPRPVDERHREVEATLHAARVAAHLPVGGLGQADPLEQLVRTRGAHVAGQRLERRLQAEVLAARQQPIERGLLERCADAGPNLRPLAGDVVTADARDAGRRR